MYFRIRIRACPSRHLHRRHGRSHRKRAPSPLSPRPATRITRQASHHVVASEALHFQRVRCSLPIFRNTARPNWAGRGQYRSTAGRRPDDTRVSAPAAEPDHEPGQALAFLGELTGGDGGLCPIRRPRDGSVRRRKMGWRGLGGMRVVVSQVWLRLLHLLRMRRISAS